MTANQFKTALARLGLTQVGAARLLKADDRTVRRWIAGERSIPWSIATIIRLLLAGKIKPDDLA